VAGLAANWYRVFQDKGLEIIQVMRVGSEGKTPSIEELNNWRIVNGAGYVVARDAGGSLPLMHPMPDIVSTVLIDKHQEIRLQARPTPEELLDQIQALLREE